MKFMQYSINSFVFILASFLVLPAAIAQTPTRLGPPEKDPVSQEKEAVRQVIDDLFDAMRAGDGDKVGSLFTSEAKLQRAGVNREGNPQLGNTPVSQFVNAVNQPHEQVWDERVWDVDIKVDGRLASAWMNFAFYFGDNLSHCGVNSMQFFKGEEGWKIMYLADTNQREGCDIPENVQNGGRN